MSEAKLAVVIPTCNRPELLANRALRSVLGQSVYPEFLIVVDDSDKKIRGINQEIVATRKLDGCKTFYLENYRTPGACGAWNTALTHLYSIPEAKGCYVALLDDDDAWEPTYLQECLEAAKAKNADVVVSGIKRIDELQEEKLPVADHFDTTMFLTGNPHWQGSNTFARLSTLLKAGLFDENLPSTNDRDMAIRILDLPDSKWEFLPRHLVRHYAETSRDRLSSSGSPRKKHGLNTFYAKHKCRMSLEEQEGFKTRAKKLFACEILEENLCNVDMRAIQQTMPQIELPPKSALASVRHLVIGAIASKQTVIPLGLLREVQELARRNPTTDIHLLFYPNYPYNSNAWHEIQNSCTAATNKKITCIQLPEKHKGSLSISEARTRLQLCCFNYLEEHFKDVPKIPVWILDDDARLDIPIEPCLTRRDLNHIEMIGELEQTGVDIIVGSVCGEPPLPFASTVRLQLLDLFYNLKRMSNQALARVSVIFDPYVYDLEHNQRLRNKYGDFYYDLSRVDTGHLETPFWYEPLELNVSFGGAFQEMVERLSGIFAGRQVFRTIFGEQKNLPDNLLPQFNRGPNTIIFKREALKNVPNISPCINGQYTRRSDMNWALLCHYVEGLRVEKAPFPIRQDRSDIYGKDDLGVDVLVFDIVGYAFSSALRSTLIDARTHNLRMNNVEKNLLLLDFSNSRLQEAVRYTRKYLIERIKAFELSYLRIQGLLEALQIYCLPGSSKQTAFWFEHMDYRNHAEQLTFFVEQMRTVYSTEKLQELTQKMYKLDDSDIITFFRDLRCHVALAKGAL